MIVGLGTPPLAIVDPRPQCPEFFHLAPGGHSCIREDASSTAMRLFLSPAIALGVPSQDMIPVNQIAVSLCAWGLVAYVLSK